jgi:putative Mg2+ transporter-C (MgtC) family protein
VWELSQTLDIAVRILVAILLGAAIGVERQWRLRTAGIRTNALVSAGAALFVVVGAVGIGEGPSADPTRVAAQVVSGIGFLGAGVILRDGLKIRGLTTAATLWCAAAVGSLAGAGQGWIALIGAAAIVGTNTLLRPLSRRINRRTAPADAQNIEEDESQELMLEVITTTKGESRVRALVLQAVSRPEFTLRVIDTRPGKNSQVKVRATVVAATPGGSTILERAVHSISLDPTVVSTKWWQTSFDE